MRTFTFRQYFWIFEQTFSYQFASTPVTLRTDNHSSGFNFPSPSLSAASKASRNSFIRRSSRPFLFINAKSPPLIVKMYSTMFCTATNTFPDWRKKDHSSTTSRLSFSLKAGLRIDGVLAINAPWAATRRVRKLSPYRAKLHSEPKSMVLPRDSLKSKIGRECIQYKYIQGVPTSLGYANCNFLKLRKVCERS